MKLLDELERLAALGLPEWSEILTDQTDPVIAELSAAIDRDRAVRDEVIAYLSRCDDPVVGHF